MIYRKIKAELSWRAFSFMFHLECVLLEGKGKNEGKKVYFFKDSMKVEECRQM